MPMIKQNPKLWGKKTEKFLSRWYLEVEGHPQCIKHLNTPVVGLERKDIEQINTQKHYDEVYRDGLENVDYKRIRHFWRYTDIRNRLKKGESFIDVGGGPGGCMYLLYLLLGMPKEKRFVILDFANAAKRGFYNFCYNIWGEFIHSKIEDYKVVEQFDIVLCGETLEHLDDIYEGLRKIWKLVKPGGLLLGSLPHGYLKDGAEHMWRTDHDGIFHAVEELWQVPITFYPWVWIWGHIYFSAVKQDIHHDPIAEWERDIFKDLDELEFGGLECD